LGFVQTDVRIQWNPVYELILVLIFLWISLRGKYTNPLILSRETHQKPKKKTVHYSTYFVLRTLEERFLSKASKEEFGQMILEKNLPLGTVLKWQVLVEARRGTITAGQPHSSLHKGAVQNSP